MEGARTMDTTSRQAREGRLLALAEQYPGSHGIAEAVGRGPSRFALVERNDGLAGGYWLSTHDTPEGAANYNTQQEHAEDWTPLFLVDLDTGDERPGARTMAVAFGDPLDRESER